MGELADALNHVMNIDNEQSNSNMVLENLDVLKDCRQFIICISNFPRLLQCFKDFIHTLDTGCLIFVTILLTIAV